MAKIAATVETTGTIYNYWGGGFAIWGWWTEKKKTENWNCEKKAKKRHLGRKKEKVSPGEEPRSGNTTSDKSELESSESSLDLAAQTLC